MSSSRSVQGYFSSVLVVNGKLSGSGDIVLDGPFAGDVDVRGSVQVGPNARVQANVQSTQLVVDGVMRGSARAETVAIRAGGRIEGEVRARRISIDDGGTLEGGIDMEFEVPFSREKA